MALPTDRAVALRAEPEVSAVPASIPSAVKRNWRGQFIKRLRFTPDGERCWLIWSRYHNAWHQRSSTGGAAGYTNDIARAGLFDRKKADEYNDGDRNEAFHASEKLPQLLAAYNRHAEALECLELAINAAAKATT